MTIQMAAINSKIVKFANEFNRHLNYLGRVYSAKARGTFEEEEAQRTRKRVNIVIAAEPMFFIKTVGPYYLKYGDLIRDQKWEEFLTMDFTNDLKEQGMDQREDVHASMEFGKEVYKKSSPAEIEAVGKVVTEMLSIYCQYALECKEQGV